MNTNREISEVAHKDIIDKLIQCVKNNTIESEWNGKYLEYLESEFKRIYPDNTKLDIEYLLKNKETNGFEELTFRLKGDEKLDTTCFDKANIMGIKFDNITIPDLTFLNAKLNYANFNNGALVNANFKDTMMDGVKFNNTKLIQTRFIKTNLKNAIFDNTNLESALFDFANLRSAQFRHTLLKNTSFKSIIIDDETNFFNVLVDNKTDFTDVDLSKCHLYPPEIRTILEDNIREYRWLEWYKKARLFSLLTNIYHLFLNILSKKGDLKRDYLFMQLSGVSKNLPKMKGEKNGNIIIGTMNDYENHCMKKYNLKSDNPWWIKSNLTWSLIEDGLPKKENSIPTKIFLWFCLIVDTIINIITILFWEISNYGRSTVRIVLTFIFWNLAWGIFYLIMSNTMGFKTPLNGTELDIFTLLIQSNLVAFYPDVMGTITEFGSSLFVFLHIGGCYVILAALVTRFAIMFQRTNP